MSGPLNPDVYAGDILRDQYRYQMDEHARLARYARDLRNDLERVEARQRTAAERATSIMETLARYGGMLPASVDRSGEAGETAKHGSTEGESAVPKADAQGPSA